MLSGREIEILSSNIFLVLLSTVLCGVDTRRTSILYSMVVLKSYGLVSFRLPFFFPILNLACVCLFLQNELDIRNRVSYYIKTGPSFHWPRFPSQKLITARYDDEVLGLMV